MYIVYGMGIEYLAAIIIIGGGGEKRKGEKKGLQEVWPNRE